MAGNEEHADVYSSVAMGHGSKNRGHRGREGVRVNSPRPRMGPEVMAEAVVAMAGGVELMGANEMGSRGQETRN